VTPVWPIMAADGRQAWPEGERPVSRVYTIRRIDVEAGEVDIDFVLHDGDDMPGARFGMEAGPGAIVGVTGPGGGNLKQAARYLFLGDETALPAISRMLEELPPEAEATAFVEIADEAEKQALSLRPGIDLRWLSRDGRPAGTTTLLEDAVRSVDRVWPEGDIHVWVGCEQAAARAIRGFVRKEMRLPRERHLVAAYWRRGQAGDVED
jgi:NADPH-dependent ferric siderophore reductase